MKEKDFVVNVGTAGPKQTGFLVASTFSSIKKKNQDENSNFTMDKLGI